MWVCGFGAVSGSCYAVFLKSFDGGHQASLLDSGIVSAPYIPLFLLSSVYGYA